VGRWVKEGRKPVPRSRTKSGMGGREESSDCVEMKRGKVDPLEIIENYSFPTYQDFMGHLIIQ